MAHIATNGWCIDRPSMVVVIRQGSADLSSRQVRMLTLNLLCIPMMGDRRWHIRRGDQVSVRPGS